MCLNAPQTLRPIEAHILEAHILELQANLKEHAFGTFGLQDTCPVHPSIPFWLALAK